MARRWDEKPWWRRPLACWLDRHRWERDTLPRLMILNDSWPPDMCDGLPWGGQRFNCRACGKAEIRAVR